MTALEKLILEELEDTEGDACRLSDSMEAFGFDPLLGQASYQDKLNRNVLNPTGKGRA